MKTMKSTARMIRLNKETPTAGFKPRFEYRSTKMTPVTRMLKRQ
jgi:hypothetical protein